MKKKDGTVRFEGFRAAPTILRAVMEMGFEAATPIQAQAMPIIMEGRDVIGQAQDRNGGRRRRLAFPFWRRLTPKE